MRPGRWTGGTLRKNARVGSNPTRAALDAAALSERMQELRACTRDRLRAVTFCPSLTESARRKMLHFADQVAYKTNMNVPSYLVDTPVARELVRAGSVRSARAFPVPGGWSIQLDIGMEQRMLRTERGMEPRVFRKVETMLSYARHRLGLARLEMDMQQWEASDRTQVA
jgi:hypothetical protein